MKWPDASAIKEGSCFGRHTKQRTQKTRWPSSMFLITVETPRKSRVITKKQADKVQTALKSWETHGTNYRRKGNVPFLQSCSFKLFQGSPCPARTPCCAVLLQLPAAKEAVLIRTLDDLSCELNQWIGRQNRSRKPCFSPSNIGFSCRFSLEPMKCFASALPSNPKFVQLRSLCLPSMRALTAKPHQGHQKEDTTSTAALWQPTESHFTF